MASILLQETELVTSGMQFEVRVCIQADRYLQDHDAVVNPLASYIDRSFI
jgi:hypothetical protein